jgi:hypothetical protein
MCPNVSTSCASPGTLRTCPAIGEPSFDTECTWGCLQNIADAHCGVLDPGGGAATTEDLDSTGLEDVDLDGTFDDNGAIAGVHPRTSGENIKDGIDYTIRNGIAIYRFKSLHVTGPVALGNAHPTVFIAEGPIVIDGVIDAQGSCTDNNAVAGGSAGGNKDQSGSGNGHGSAGGLGQGGGGAGYGGKGGKGSSIIGAGNSFGDPEITLLVGGGGGGGATGSFGGAGGGAVQLVSNTSIQFGSGGGINAGACGGKGSGNGGNDGGGGGGAGGSILVEAPTITIAGKLAVNGGGGGCKGGVAGDNATLDRNQAQGCAGSAVSNGDGGVANDPDGDDGAAVIGVGGGGAVGRMRFNTRLGSADTLVLQSGSVLSPSPTDNNTRTTHGAPRTH